MLLDFSVMFHSFLISSFVVLLHIWNYPIVCRTRSQWVPLHTQLLSQHELQLSVCPVTTSPLGYLLALSLGALQLSMGVSWDGHQFSLLPAPSLLPSPAIVCCLFLWDGTSLDDSKEAELLVLLLAAISSGHSTAGLTGNLLIPQPRGACQGWKGSLHGQDNSSAALRCYLLVCFFSLFGNSVDDRFQKMISWTMLKSFF